MCFAQRQLILPIHIILTQHIDRSTLLLLRNFPDKVECNIANLIVIVQ